MQILVQSDSQQSVGLSHPAQVCSLHTADWGGENDKVHRPQITILQAEPLDFPGVEDGEEDGALLLIRHRGAGDVQGGELSQAGTEDVGVNSGQGNTKQSQLSDVGSSKWILSLLSLLIVELKRKFN